MHDSDSKIEELYEPDWKAWFGQDGDSRHGTADDPRIVLIGIDVHAAVFLEVNKPKPVDRRSGYATIRRWDCPLRACVFDKLCRCTATPTR